MSDREVSERVLDLLQSEAGPVRPAVIYGKLKEESIAEVQSRRALVGLAVDHKITITNDRRVTLSALTPA